MWFRVDDHFWQHRKLLAVPARYRNEVAGLWVRAGSWCAMNLTDGLIDSTVPPTLLDAGAAAITRIEFSGLWVPAPSGGWQMHDWQAWNPTRAQIEQRREDDRKRKHQGPPQ